MKQQQFRLGCDSHITRSLIPFSGSHSLEVACTCISIAKQYNLVLAKWQCSSAVGKLAVDLEWPLKSMAKAEVKDNAQLSV